MARWTAWVARCALPQAVSCHWIADDVCQIVAGRDAAVALRGRKPARWAECIARLAHFCLQVLSVYASALVRGRFVDEVRQAICARIISNI